MKSLQVQVVLITLVAFGILGSVGFAVEKGNAERARLFLTMRILPAARRHAANVIRMVKAWKRLLARRNFM